MRLKANGTSGRSLFFEFVIAAAVRIAFLKRILFPAFWSLSDMSDYLPTTQRYSRRQPSWLHCDREAPTSIHPGGFGGRCFIERWISLVVGGLFRALVYLSFELAKSFAQFTLENF